MHLARLTAVLAFAFATTMASAVTPTAPRELPNLKLRANADAYRVLKQPDGKLIVTGSFTAISDAAAANLVRLNADGSLDSSWNPGIEVLINVAEISPDGNLYAVLSTAGVLKIPLSGNGTPVPDDTFWFEDYYAVIKALAIDGNYLYAAEGGGMFRYDASTGDRDWSWNGAINGDHLIADHAGHLYVDQNRINISDGSLDASWSSPTVHAPSFTALGNDGYLYIGAQGTIGGTSIEGLARFAVNAGGAIDSAWHPVAVGDAANSRFDAIIANGDGTVVVAGLFDRIGGAARSNIAHLMGGQGVADPTWLADSDGEVATLADGPANSLVAGGSFTSIAATPRASLARLSSSGTVDAAFTPALFAPALISAITPDHANGDIYIGGQFDWAGTERHRNILRLGSDGLIDSTWTPVVGPPQPQPFNAAAVHAIALNASDVIVGGDFMQVNGTTRTAVAKLSKASPGTLDISWNPDLSGSFSVVSRAQINAVTFDAQGRVLIGGDFQKVGGTDQGMLARLNTNGALDTTWRPYPDYPVSRFAYDGGQELYFIASSASKIGLDDGAFDDTWDQAAHQLRQAADIAYVNGHVLVAGAPTATETLKTYRLSATSGAIDTNWNPATTCPISRVAVDSVGVIYAGGWDSDAHACLQRIRADGSIDAAFVPQWSTPTYLLALAIGDDDVPLAGGLFRSVSGVERYALAAFDNEDVIFHSGFDR